MSKIKSKKTRQGIFSFLQTIASLSVVLIWASTISALYLVGIPTWIVILLFAITAGMVGMFIFVFIIDKEMFDRIVNYFKFVHRGSKGKDEINLFQLPIDDLKKHIPIEKVHDHGLIEYISPDQKSVRIVKRILRTFKVSGGGNRPFGVAFKYDPPQVPESEEVDFNDAVKRIVDSIGPGLQPSLHYYCMIDGSNPLADSILVQLNDPTISVQQMKHLQGMYEAATENTDPRIADEYMFAIKLGQFNTVEHAMQVFRSTVPGILQSFQEQGIYVTQLVDEGSIAMEFSNFAIMERR